MINISPLSAAQPQFGNRRLLRTLATAAVLTASSCVSSKQPPAEASYPPAAWWPKDTSLVRTWEEIDPTQPDFRRKLSPLSDDQIRVIRQRGKGRPLPGCMGDQ